MERQGITTASDSNDIWRGMFRLRIVPVLSELRNIKCKWQLFSCVTVAFIKRN